LLLPEERLLLAVLESAYWDLKSRHALDRRQARTYFLSEDGRHAFSFMAVCQHFGWSAESIRTSLRQHLINEQGAELLPSTERARA
jgi:hypothetical protein